jgi:hypothetical protein
LPAFQYKGTQLGCQWVARGICSRCSAILSASGCGDPPCWAG